MTLELCRHSRATNTSASVRTFLEPCVVTWLNGTRRAGSRLCTNGVKSRRARSRGGAEAASPHIGGAFSVAPLMFRIRGLVVLRASI